MGIQWYRSAQFGGIAQLNRVSPSITAVNTATAFC